MSIISNFIEKLTGLDLDNSSGNVTEHPCSNCPSDCKIAGEVCAICEPYKKKLIDAVYHVEHIDEFRSQYEVVGNMQTAAVSGTVTCPRCGASSANHYICDYCGAQLSEEPVSSGKIQVAAASDIPNPIMEAQDIIYERYDAIVRKYTEQKSSSGGFLSNLFSEIIDTETDDDDESALGAKMSESEIKEAAELYKVSVADYLIGLDNGKYLTLSGKKSADEQGTSSFSPALAGISGMAGIGMIAGGLMGRSSGKNNPRVIPQNPVRDNERYPSRNNHKPPMQEPKPGPETPSQRETRPEQMDHYQYSEEKRSIPSYHHEPQPAQHEQRARSDHWKERNPERRR